MRKLKKSIILCLTLVLLCTSTLNATAAGLKDLFDAEYYAKRYEDLSAAFGNDSEALYQHYLTYGINEGRIASPAFNVREYRSKYADLENAFGDNWASYAEHYLTYGLAEGRDAGGEFDAVSYANRYPDLYKAFGYDAGALYAHYLTYGIAEGRNAVSQDLAVEIAAEAAAQAAAENAAEADAPSTETGSGNTSSESSIEGTVSDAGTSEDNTSDNNTPAGSTPEASTPEDSTPETSAPEDSTDGDTVISKDPSTYSEDLQMALEILAQAKEAWTSHDTDTYATLYEKSKLANAILFDDTEIAIYAQAVEDTRAEVGAGFFKAPSISNPSYSEEDEPYAPDIDTSNLPQDRAWIDDLYNKLVSNDYEGVMAILQDDSIAEKAEPYKYITHVYDAYAYRLVTTDGKIVGLQLPADLTQTAERAAFFSTKKINDYGFSHIEEGDYVVTMRYNPATGVEEYSWLGGDTTVHYSDGSTYELEENGIYIVWAV